MRILIIGGTGMAGHMIKNYFKQLSHHDVWYTARIKQNDSTCFALDVMNEANLANILNIIQPHIVINAVGLLNEDAARRVREAIYINSLIPHKLAFLGNSFGFKVIHISTDCVFSGIKGLYTEMEPTDGDTVYAKTKSLGEITEGPHVTIRTSIIGPELKPHGIGLFHWFMKQTGEINGYRNVFWNGVTTFELAKAIDWLIQYSVEGLVHLSSPERVSKYQLLVYLKDIFKRDDVHIKPYDYLLSDKTLINTRSDFVYPVPRYKEMLEELYGWMQQQGKEEYRHYERS